MPPFDMAAYAEMRQLLDTVAEHEDALTANERELFRSLLAKYREPIQTAFDDPLCLELMLRNIEIRRGHGMAPADATGRIFEVERKGTKTDGE